MIAIINTCISSLTAILVVCDWFGVFEKNRKQKLLLDFVEQGILLAEHEDRRHVKNGKKLAPLDKAKIAVTWVTEQAASHNVLCSDKRARKLVEIQLAKSGQTTLAKDLK